MKNKLFFSGVNPGLRKNMGYFRIFSTAWYLLLMAAFVAGCAKDVATDPGALPPAATALIAATIPANLADTVPINPVVAVTFKSAVTASEISTTTITLKQGSTAVAGTMTTSGSTASFTPKGDLNPETTYTATVKTMHSDGSHRDEDDHSWSFRTGKHRSGNSVSVASTFPLDHATAVAVSVQPTATFSAMLSNTMIQATAFTLKQGSTNVAGTVTYSGNTGTFKPASPLLANTVYTGTITFGNNNSDEEDDDNKSGHLYTWSFTTVGGGADLTAPTVSSVAPSVNATLVAVSSKVNIVFSELMNPSTINATTFTLKQGATNISGTVTYTGNTATFAPTAPLVAGTVYTGTIATGAKDAAGNALAANYSWSFTTATVVVTDVTPPTVQSVTPANSATSIAINSSLTATFSEAMSASTISSSTFTLKQGTTTVAGTVSYSGTTATFTPSAALTGNTVYTANITTGAKDVAGNLLAATYAWSFTTATVVIADVTPPTVSAVSPAASATSVAISSKVTATFSEAMSASTISATTFTLKQGMMNVAGTVTYSGTTATFTPSAALANGVVYTATITTGSKDAAGNALAADKTWSFTTVAAVSVVSWSAQVWPIIQSKCTVCHSTSGGPAGINMGTYAQVAAMSNSQIDNPGMYSKMGGDHSRSGTDQSMDCRR